MFQKILIANRGEIACRILRTCKKMDLKTVAVYSEADSQAKHVRLADESFLIGPAPVNKSYLNAQKIIEIAKSTGAQAVHPGFGFLSENGDFAEALERQSLKLIGPGANVIRLMGDKIRARKTALQASVNVIPWYDETISDPKRAFEIAKEIAFPVMIKASAGGGGKGMRLCREESTFLEDFAAAQREAMSSFGDGRVYIEKFIENPRHIEIQILADQHGSVVHLGERECSLQRRHQKVIEEAPSSFLDVRIRKEMGLQAVALAKAVGYYSVGTVEFILDQHKNFYFLEMNTRLQVEHPVTEYITGRDLVEDMIRIAAGEPLNLTQEDIKFSGHAVEARVYAENPEMDFIPSPGTLKIYQEPKNATDVRVDSGVEEGDQISPFYDPMIAKVISFAGNRGAAIEKLSMALDSYVIQGLDHNISFLQALLNHDRFKSGDINTLFIDTEFKGEFSASLPLNHSFESFFAAVAASIFTISQRKVPETQWVVKRDGVFQIASLSVLRAQGYEIAWAPGEVLCRVSLKGVPQFFQVRIQHNFITLTQCQYRFQADIYPAEMSDLLAYMPQQVRRQSSNIIQTPMPGRLIQLRVHEGETIKRGQILAVIEAMKMENVVRSPKNAIVEKICVSEGETLEANTNLVIIK